MKLCDAKWVPSASAEATVSETLCAARLAGQGVATTQAVAVAENKQKAEGDKGDEGDEGNERDERKKGKDEETGRRPPRHSYFLRPSSHPSFFPGRAADIYVNGQQVQLTLMKHGCSDAVMCCGYVTYSFGNKHRLVYSVFCIRSS